MRLTESVCKNLPVVPDLDAVGSHELEILRIISTFVYPGMIVSIVLYLTGYTRYGLDVMAYLVISSIFMHLYTSARLARLHEENLGEEFNVRILQELRSYGRAASTSEVYESFFEIKSPQTPKWFDKRFEYFTETRYANKETATNYTITEKGSNHIQRFLIKKAQEIEKNHEHSQQKQ